LRRLAAEAVLLDRRFFAFDDKMSIDFDLFDAPPAANEKAARTADNEVPWECECHGVRTDQEKPRAPGAADSPVYESWGVGPGACRRT